MMEFEVALGIIVVTALVLAFGGIAYIEGKKVGRAEVIKSLARGEPWATPDAIPGWMFEPQDGANNVYEAHMAPPIGTATIDEIQYPVVICAQRGVDVGKLRDDLQDLIDRIYAAKAAKVAPRATNAPEATHGYPRKRRGGAEVQWSIDRPWEDD